VYCTRFTTDFYTHNIPHLHRFGRNLRACCGGTRADGTAVNRTAARCATATILRLTTNAVHHGLPARCHHLCHTDTLFIRQPVYNALFPPTYPPPPPLPTPPPPPPSATPAFHLPYHYRDGALRLPWLRTPHYVLRRAGLYFNHNAAWRKTAFQANLKQNSLPLPTYHLTSYRSRSPYLPRYMRLVVARCLAERAHLTGGRRHAPVAYARLAH